MKQTKLKPEVNVKTAKQILEAQIHKLKFALTFDLRQKMRISITKEIRRLQMRLRDFEYLDSI